MKTIAFVIFIFIFIFFLLTLLAQFTKYARTHQKPPYRKKPELLNGREQQLFQLLREALPDRHILCQVRLADIVQVDKRHNDFWHWFNRIAAKSVDFVICDHTFDVLACIELDGRTHHNEQRQKADREKDVALKAAGVPVIRINTSTMPNAERLKEMVKDAMTQATPLL